MLKEYECRDYLDNQGKKNKYSRDYQWLNMSDVETVKGLETDSDQLNTWLCIKEKLKEYNEALVLQSMIHKMQTPDMYDIKDMQQFLLSIGLPLIGADAFTWGRMSLKNSHSPDLIALSPRRREDTFSMFIAENSIKWFKFGIRRFKKKNKGHDAWGYHDSSIFRITLWFTSILAAVLPIAPIIIFVLKMHSRPARLAVIAAFNVLFALCLNVFTVATRKDIFSITAIFTIGQLIFVGTDKDPSLVQGHVLAQNATCQC